MFRYPRFPTSRWGSLPPAASVPGRIYRITDYGVGAGLLMISDGVRWVPMGPQVLARATPAASVTGTTNETTLATVTIPANLLGIAGSLRVYHLLSVNNSAGTKSTNVKLGTTTFGGISGLSTHLSANQLMVLRNKTAASQISYPTGSSGMGTASAASVVAGTVDTTLSQDLTITATLGSGADSLTLQHYTIELLP